MSAGSSGGTGLAGRDVVFALDRRYRAPLITRGAAALVLAGLAAAIASGIAVDAAWGFAAAFGAVALCYAVRYAWASRFRTRLSAEGIEARGYFNHFVRWPDVTGIEATGFNLPDQRRLPAAPYMGESGAVSPSYDTVRPGAGQLRWQWQMANPEPTAGYRSKLATVRVARSGRRRLLLRAPLVTAWSGDPEFGDKVQLIHRWWQAYGKGAAP
jgi:hypothetical protein